MKNALKLLFIIPVLLMFNCGGDDTPAVLPTVEFSHVNQIVEVGDDVAFVSTHTDVSSFSWDFGDGETSTEQNPTHTYTTTGDFTITLTVTSSTGDTASSTSMVVVGTRWIAGFTINSINMTDDNGAPWDANDGVDLFFGYAPASAANISLFNLGEDLAVADFPRGGPLETEDQVQFTDEDWSFLFLDNDEPADDINESQTIGVINVNPVAIEANERDLVTGRGVFLIEVQDFSFAIFYEIRN